jgi:putative membrane protein
MALTGTHRFPGEGWLRAGYLLLLGSHTLLAAAIVPLIAVTLWLAFQGRFDAHRRIARYTLPAWLYVSVTGVLVYVMLYWVAPMVS